MSNSSINKKNILLTLIIPVSLISIIIINNFNILSEWQIYTSLIQQILGYVFLAYMPGNLFLKLIGIKKIDVYDEIVYSIGLSLSIVMVTGVLVNIVYPSIGISRPISTWPLILTFCIINLLFSILIEFKNVKDYNIKKKNIFLFAKMNYLPCLYISLLPLLAIIGAAYSSFNSNYILICLIILISFIPIMVITGRIIKEPVYPLTIYMMSLGLLLQNTMVSQYPMRINVDMEYLYQQLVIQNGFWSSNIPIASNSVLSIVMIAPIFEQIMDISSYWMFRCGYPILFAFVPVVLYQIYSKQFEKKNAFLGVCFFIFFFYFFTEATLLRRQQIALIYFSLILLISMAKEIPWYKRKMLMTIFTFSIIVAHYSVSMILLLLLLIGFAFFNLLKIDFIQTKLPTFKSYLPDNNYSFSNTYILIFISMAISWFLYVGSGKLFSTLTLLSENIYTDFFLQSDKSMYINAAFGSGFFDVSIHGKIYRLLQYSSQVFLIIGSITSIIKSKKLSSEYIQFVVAATFLLLITVVTPHISTAINIFRIYFVLLCILSPFCLQGAEVLHSHIRNIIYRICKYCNCYSTIKVPFHNAKKVNFRKLYVLLFLIPFFLYNSGLIFEVGNFNVEESNTIQIPRSSSLSYSFNSGYHEEKEIVAAKRIGELANEKVPIYGDVWIGYDLISAFNNNSMRIYDERDLSNNSNYVFLRSGNTMTKRYGILNPASTLYINSFDKYEKVYDVGNVSVLFIL